MLSAIADYFSDYSNNSNNSGNLVIVETKKVYHLYIAYRQLIAFIDL